MSSAAISHFLVSSHRRRSIEYKTLSIYLITFSFRVKKFKSGVRLDFTAGFTSLMLWCGLEVNVLNLRMLLFIVCIVRSSSLRLHSC